jgi:hypothetical protein
MCNVQMRTVACIHELIKDSEAVAKNVRIICVLTCNSGNLVV